MPLLSELLMRNILIPYGNSQLSFSVKNRNLIGVFSPSKLTSPPDPHRELERALDDPIGSEEIECIVKGKNSVAIVVDDITRRTPTEKVLSVLLDRVRKDGGIKRDKITIIVALGTHRQMTQKEMEQKLGSAILEDYTVIQHQCSNLGELKFLGRAGGIDIWINRHALAADVRIGVGCIVPHDALGWSGGSKILLPGIAGHETVSQMHLYTANELGNVLGKTENPARNMADMFARKAGLHAVINVVLNHEYELYRAFYGDFIAAHRKGVEEARRVYCFKLPSMTDVTVASSYPFDGGDFWIGGDRGLGGASLMTKRGGGIVLVACCPEGFSSSHEDFAELLQYGREEINRRIQLGEVGDLSAAAGAITIARFREAHEICLISKGISQKDAARIGFTKVNTIEEALEHLSQPSGAIKKVGVITHGGVLVPILS